MNSTVVQQPQTQQQQQQMTTPRTQMAGRGQRLMAAIVDGLIAAIAYFVPLFFLNSIEIMLACILGVVVFQIYLLSKDGQSIGKKMLGIKIVKYDTGQNGGFMTNVVMRLILNGIIAIIPFYGLVDVLFIFRQDQRCIHDLIAGTKVVTA
jgi:uncharacterized RDD family membrane protein YckC